MMEPGTVIRSKYRITAPLSRGGMGELFYADETATGRKVVIKTLLSSLSERVDLKALLFEEAEITLRLSHPRIVRVLDYGRFEDSCFYAMELLTGATLGALMRQAYDERRGVDPAVVLSVGIQLSEALEHGAHAIGKSGEPMALVHRDLSPLNVFITCEGCVKLLDFGIAKVAGASRHRLSPTLRGKPSYRSPEMVLGEDVDARSDLFTLGIILWEALVGRKLFCSQPIDESERRILKMNIPAVSAASPKILERLMRLHPHLSEKSAAEIVRQIDELTAKALQRPLKARFQSALDMRAALLCLFRQLTNSRHNAVLKNEVAAWRATHGLQS